MTDLFTVILFHTSSHALRAEKLLKQQELTCKLIPVPRHLSSDCGVCLRVPQAEGEAAGRLLAAAGIEIAGRHDSPGPVGRR